MFMHDVVYICGRGMKKLQNTIVRKISLHIDGEYVEGWTRMNNKWNFKVTYN